MNQAFRQNDATEKKVADAASPALALCGDALDEFFAGAETCFRLGDVIFELKRAPLTDAISQETFRRGFYALFQLFKRPGTFEYYLSVFRAIFGENVYVEFSIPGPAQLKINLTVLDTSLENAAYREVVGITYEVGDLLTSDGDELIFQVDLGPKSQSEFDAIMLELVPAGIFLNGKLVSEFTALLDEDSEVLTDEDDVPLTFG